MLILNNAKEVKYYGFTFYVPTYVNYIAVDKDGSVYGYENEPYTDERYEMFEPAIPGDYCLINDIVFELTGDWKLSLQRV